MNTTLDFLQSRARRSVRRWQQHETEQHAREAHIDLVMVAIAQCVESVRDVVDVLDLDDEAHMSRITTLAHLLHGDAQDDILGIVERWLEEDPDDDVIEQLYAALLILEGSPGVTKEHWLSEVSQAN
ncbi:MAG: hypothetical protein JNL21_07325 [Myxococcales bacterium]|nr:hypothetical protein [Myxococcales bacterium]